MKGKRGKERAAGDRRVGVKGERGREREAVDIREGE